MKKDFSLGRFIGYIAIAKSGIWSIYTKHNTQRYVLFDVGIVYYLPAKKTKVLSIIIGPVIFVIGFVRK